MPISSPLAGEPDLPERSQVGLALRGVLFAVLVGGAVIGLALWIVSGMMASPSAAWPTLTPAAPGQGAPIRPDAPPGIVLVAGLVGAAGAAFLTAVAALAPIGS
ncbi:MAG TPA: hypothetical protein VNK43_00575, partial [Gemmatimonadales bacterium]|nr:hypothetical protein [Gemmatimonadales bacterium]